MTHPTTQKRMRRIIAWVAGALVGLGVVAVAGLLVWSQIGVMAAEPAPVAAVQQNPAITTHDTTGAIVLEPAAGGSRTGLVFIPGAKVDPWAYAAKLSGLVADDGMTVVITRPWLNLAFFDARSLESFEALAPGVRTWLVGGHSLGGVRACQLATGADALVLFASYCANDLSTSGLPMLSLSGSDDGLSTPAKIADARHLLPTDAELVEIPGASHSSFGDYGLQPGDGTPTIPDEVMTAALTELVGEFAETVPSHSHR